VRTRTLTYLHTHTRTHTHLRQGLHARIQIICFIIDHMPSSHLNSTSHLFFTTACRGHVTITVMVARSENFFFAFDSDSSHATNTKQQQKCKYFRRQQLFLQCELRLLQALKSIRLPSMHSKNIFSPPNLPSPYNRREVHLCTHNPRYCTGIRHLLIQRRA
jgi:hypothetical protein